LILFGTVRKLTASREIRRELLGDAVMKTASHRNCTLQVTWTDFEQLLQGRKWQFVFTLCRDLCVVASRDFSIMRRWLLPRQLGAVGVCISLRSLNAPFSVITVKCCQCHKT